MQVLKKFSKRKKKRPENSKIVDPQIKAKYREKTSMKGWRKADQKPGVWSKSGVTLKRQSKAQQMRFFAMLQTSILFSNFNTVTGICKTLGTLYNLVNHV